MGVLNVTPDSFSDGGVHLDAGVAARAARAMIADGAALVDVGGEAARPGSDGGLRIGAYQPAPSPRFTSSGDARASRITAPARFYEIGRAHV